MRKCIPILVALALLIGSAANLPAQSLFATLTGVVSDQSQAVVPGATVKLVNDASGSARETVTNEVGYFSFSSVAVGNFTYTLTVEAPGFVSYKATALAIQGGDKRNVNVTLTVGSTAETVEVTGVAETIVPVDSGEKSQTLTTKELENYVVVGSNAAQFIKIMPGFGIQNGARNKANYDGQTMGINANGDAGS
jgi:hypothetical protein